MTPLIERLNSGVLVCDGAMGTMLHAAGMALDQALPGLNLTRPELVRDIHISYVEAGVDMIQTNTFAGSRLRLAERGLESQWEEVNRAAVRIAREASSARRAILVAGSVSPAVSVHQRPQVGARERAEAVADQVRVLSDGGVDLILLETFGDLDELVEAVDAAAAVARIPIVAQAAFGPDARTLSGHTPQEVAMALARSPVAALGVNCVIGPHRSLQVVRELRRHTDRPLSAQPNAGLPRRVAPARFQYDADTDYFARYVTQLVDAGVSLVGGCCGTAPATLAAAVEAVEQTRRQRGGAVVSLPAAPPEPPATPVQRVARAGRLLAVQMVAPPVDGLAEYVRTVAEVAALGVDLISVVPSYSVRPRVKPIDVALHLHERLEVETMAAVTTWDRAGVVLQADLLGAHALGLRRVVCETGSPPLRGDYPHIDGVWDLDSIGLVGLLSGLNSGRDHYGLPVPAKTEFEIGARMNPGSHDPDHEQARTLAKLERGVNFLVTRPVYEADGLRRLVDAVGGRAPVYATVAPLTDFDRADYLAHEVPDVIIPDSTMATLHGARGAADRIGLDLAVHLVAEIQPLVSGVIIAPRASATSASGEVVVTVRALLEAFSV